MVDTLLNSGIPGYRSTVRDSYIKDDTWLVMQVGKPVDLAGHPDALRSLQMYERIRRLLDGLLA